MALYKYQATKQNGEIVVGEKDVANYDELATELNKQGLMVISIEKKVDVNLGGFFSKMQNFELGGVSMEEKVIFSRQLATMLSAGLPVTQAIEILLQQTKYVKMRNKLSMVYKDVQAGSTLSYSFGKADLIFNELQLSLIEAGESSGNLVEIMTQIAEDIKKSASLKGKIKGAMIYPIIIFLVVIVVVIVMMLFMIPAVQDIYKGFGNAKLPEITQFMVDASNTMSNPVFIIISIIVLIAAYISFKSFYQSEKGKSLIDKLLLVLPIFGDLISKIQVLEMTRLLGMLMKSGIPIIDALNSTAKSLTNYHYKKALYNAANEVSKGVPLAVPLSKSKVIPLIVVKLISTGEQTGKLDQILTEITSFYNDQVEEMTSNLTKMMEPIVLIVVGVVVGFLALAIYVPIYNLGSVIK
jgi:type IV pilus assembly protein PilC